MYGRTLLVLSMVQEPKRSIREVIYARVRMGKCIVHDAANPKSPEDACFCEKDAATLGVCSAHDQEYRRAIHNKSPEEEATITNGLVSEGQILRPQKVREINRKSPISRIAKQATEAK